MKARFAILTFVFVLSVGFFWLALNEYLIQSRAQLAGDLQIVPHAKNIECNPKAECYLHILGSTATTNALAGVTGVIKYNAEVLTPVRVDRRGICKTSTYGMDSDLQFIVDKPNQTVTFSVGALKADADLKGGNACITTVVFKPVDSQVDSQEASLALVEPEKWKAGGLKDGQKVIFSPQIEPETIRVKIDSSIAIPDDEPLPTGTTTTTCDISKGDCSCDARIDLIDWELLRSYINTEGKSCDINGDGKGNALDASIMYKNNDLMTIPQ